MEAMGLLMDENMEEQADTKETKVPAFLAASVNKFTQVFEDTTGLPPKRSHEHAIRLKEGSGPVGV